MTISELELKMMAKEASKKYLEDKVPLNDTIAKIASERDMNGHQVARICEQANLDTYNAMWDRSKNGDFTFDVADQDKIASTINQPESMLLDEYSTPVESIKDLLPEGAAVESKTKKEARLLNVAFEKFAAAHNEEAPVSKLAILKLANRLDYYAREIDSAIFESKVSAKEAELKLKDMLKVAALNGENIATAYAAAIATYPKKTAEVREIFTRIMSDLEHNGIIFAKHAKTYTEDAEGGKLETSTINKNHAVLKHLDTVLHNQEMVPQGERAKDYIAKKVEMLNSKVISEKFDNEK